jgi:hypothetical protein
MVPGPIVTRRYAQMRPEPFREADDQVVDLHVVPAGALAPLVIDSRLLRP